MMANYHWKSNFFSQYFYKLLLYFLYLCDLENIAMLISQFLGEYFIIRNVKLRNLTQNLMYPNVLKSS